jgi:RNA polymerase sigma factor (sigma-70 family)
MPTTIAVLPMADWQLERMRRVREVAAANYPLVHHTVYHVPGIRWHVHLLGVEEAISAGGVGLLQACWKYDVKRGVQFSTFAVWCITNAIRNAATLELRARGKAGQLTDVQAQDLEAPDLAEVGPGFDVEALLAEFRPQQAEALRLTCLEGADTATTARRMGVSRQRVCEVLQQARSAGRHLERP